MKESALWLQGQGFEVDIAPVDACGFVQVEELEKLLRPDTTLVSIMAVNNEVGFYPAYSSHCGSIGGSSDHHLSRRWGSGSG